MSILVDYNKINGTYFNMATSKHPQEVTSFECRDEIYFGYINSSGVAVNLSTFLIQVRAISKYEDKYATMYSVSLKIPNAVAYDIFKMYADDRRTLEFRLNVSHNQKDRNGNIVGRSLMQYLPTDDLSVVGGFNVDPHNDLPLVMVDPPMNIPDSNATLNHDTNNDIGVHRISLSLISRDALNLPDNPTI